MLALILVESELELDLDGDAVSAVAIADLLLTVVVDERTEEVAGDTAKALLLVNADAELVVKV
jgi:hypothetical protein